MPTRRLKAFLSAHDRASPVFRKVGGAMKIMGGIAAAVGAYQIGRVLARGLAEATKAAAEQERIDAQLAQSLRNVGRSVKEGLPQIKAQANALQQLSGVANETIQSGQALLVAMGDLSGEGLERATRAALDLAAANERLGVGAAFDLLAKAATGYTSTLSRYGIILDESVPKQEKFAAALEFIEKRFGGSAAAQIETVSGQVKLLGENWADFLKVIGQTVQESGAVREFLRGLNESLNKTATFVGTMEALDAPLTALLTTAARGIGALREALLVVEAAGLGVRGILYELTLDLYDVNRTVLGWIRDIGEAIANIPGRNALGIAIVAGAEKALGNLAESVTPIAVEFAGVQLKTTDIANTITTIRNETDAWVESIRAAKDAMPGGGTGPGGAGGVPVAPATFAQIDTGGAFSFGPMQIDALKLYNRYLEEAERNVGNISQGMQQLGQQTQAVAQGAASQLVTTLVDGALEGQSNWGDFLRQVVQDLGKAILKAILLRAIMSSIGGAGFAQGGIVGATGGAAVQAAGGTLIPGFAPGRDTVPVMASPGEAVLPPELTQLLMRAAQGGGGGGGVTEIHLHGDTAQLVTRIDKVVRSGRARMTATETTSPTRTLR